MATNSNMPGESHGQRSLRATVHGVSKSWTQLSVHTQEYSPHRLLLTPRALRLARPPRFLSSHGSPPRCAQRADLVSLQGLHQGLRLTIGLPEDREDTAFKGSRIMGVLKRSFTAHISSQTHPSWPAWHSLPSLLFLRSKLPVLHPPREGHLL